jgi:hypothetical protein
MHSEQVQKQLEKWRRQERLNKVVVRSVIGLIIGLALVGITLFLVNVTRRVPAFTPLELLKEGRSWDGYTVRVTGQVKWIQGIQARVGDDDSGKSILCTFIEEPFGLREGVTITVQGTWSLAHSLTDCKLIER